MRSVRRMKAVFFARNLEYLRDRASFGWNLVFPVLIVFTGCSLFRPPRALFTVTTVASMAQSFSSSEHEIMVQTAAKLSIIVSTTDDLVVEVVEILSVIG